MNICNQQPFLVLIYRMRLRSQFVQCPKFLCPPNGKRGQEIYDFLFRPDDLTTRVSVDAKAISALANRRGPVIFLTIRSFHASEYKWFDGRTANSVHYIYE
jgi:hypothetical protein